MKNIIKTYMGLSKSVYILCSATLINRLGDFVVPFLTLFLTVKLNMSAEMSGIIVTCASLISIPSSLLGGKISDSIGRKNVYLIGQSISGFFLILCGFFTSEYIILTFIFISTFFNGFVRPAFSALLIDFLPNEKRQSGLSLNYLCINIGVSLGPVIAGFLFNRSLPIFFIADGISSLLASALVFKNIKEGYKEEVDNEVNNANEAKEDGNLIQVLFKRPQLFMFFAIFFLYQIIYSQHKFTLPVTVNTILTGDGAEIFGYMMSINAITVIILTVFITSMMKKYHHLTAIALGGVAYALGFGMVAFINSTMGFFISTFIWTIGEILTSISLGVFIADNCPINFRGRINAFQNVVFWVGSSLSTAVSGILVDSIELKFIWSGIFVIAIIASCLMYLLKIYCVTKDKVRSSNLENLNNKQRYVE